MYCKDCENWTRNEFEKKYAIDEYQTNYYRIKTKFGRCSCTNIVNGGGGILEYTEKQTNQLIYDDMEGLAELETGENFGCVHFKNRNKIDQEINKHLVIKHKEEKRAIEKGDWARVTKKEGLEALRKGENVLVIYADGTHSLNGSNTIDMLKRVFLQFDPLDILKEFTDLPERRDVFRNIVEIENVYVWKEDV